LSRCPKHLCVIDANVSHVSASDADARAVDAQARGAHTITDPAVLRIGLKIDALIVTIRQTLIANRYALVPSGAVWSAQRVFRRAAGLAITAACRCIEGFYARFTAASTAAWLPSTAAAARTATAA